METSLGTFKCEKNVYSFPKKNLNDFESHTNLLVRSIYDGKNEEKFLKIDFLYFLVYIFLILYFDSYTQA